MFIKAQFKSIAFICITTIFDRLTLMVISYGNALCVMAYLKSRNYSKLPASCLSIGFRTLLNSTSLYKMSMAVL